MQAQRPRILVVDDDGAILTLVGKIADREGFDVASTTDGTDAMVRLQQRAADLVLVDLRMPGVSGLDVLRSVREVSPRSQVVLMSGHATIDSAIEAIRLGAIDYLTKPFDMQRLRHLFAGVRAEVEQRRAVQTMDSELAQRLEFHGMIGRGSAMQEVFGLIRRLAPHARTTLITGETGTGKELAAQALHQLGPRSRKRLQTVNCSAVVETLFESELFGHVRGAFTGATEHKAGVFEAADGGTLFLDEIGELPMAVQAKLLRVIENGDVQRVGSLDSRTVDVRLLAATNRDLVAEVAAGQFRSDLYYRLNIAEVHLPPLRDRPEDLPYLTAAFVRAFASRFDKPITGISPQAEHLLATQPWEGNIRELRNVIERACMLAEGELITESDLSGVLRSVSSRRAESSGTVASHASPVLTREQISAAMEQAHGNKSIAARALGISRRAFYRQLERHGLHHPDPSVDADSPAE